MLTEIWKDVVGYEGFYEVSNLGNVRSIPRLDIRKIPRGGHLMTQRIGNKGYLSVGLRKDGSSKKRRNVHQLVLEAFVGPKSSPEIVCRHLNDVKTDNFVDNLCWGTQVENKEDSKRNGTAATRERNGGGGKLTEAQVTEIKGLLADGIKGTVIGRKFGVSKGMIYHIAKGRVWK